MSIGRQDAGPGDRRAHSDPVAWESFVAAALLLAIVAGFGLGGVLMAAEAGHRATGPWWDASAQAHGHIQLFGWAGLMVLGVGLHILPRLRGAPLAHPAWTRPTCALLVAGLVLRAAGQPAFAATTRLSMLHSLLGVAFAGSGLLEFGGVSLLLWLLGDTARQGPPLHARPAFRSVLPFFVTAFAALWLALLVNLVGLAEAIRAGDGLVPDAVDDTTAWIAFYAFLIPVSLAMSARTFPIFLRTALPRLRLLRVALLLLPGGLLLRVSGDLAGLSPIAGAGRLILATALVVAILALGIFGRRRPLPREPAPLLSDPIRVQMLSAYVWLTIVAVLLLLSGLALLGLTALPADPDAERHALGAGFITLLILGVGAFLLPGMTGRRRRGDDLLWATGACANAAALLRVVPVVVPGLVPGPTAAFVMAFSGVLGLAALVLFGRNVVVGRLLAAPVPSGNEG